MAFSGAASMFQILGFAQVDSKAAEAALTRLSDTATSMATSAEKMAGAAEKAFSRYNKSAEDTTKTTFDLQKAFEALAAAEFFNKMKEFTAGMLGATSKMQQFQRTLTGVTGSAEKANTVLKEMADYSDRTPMDTEDIKRAATLFASLKQPIKENVDLSAKLAYLFNIDLPRASLTVGEANAGVVHSMRRLAVEFAFTASQAEKYGAIVEKGHVVLGQPGSEANKRLMGALRAFVADREKGLGGDLFGGPAGLDVVFTNLKGGLFRMFASLGQQVTPTVVAIGQGLRYMLDAVRDLPGPIQSLIAHLALFLGGLGALIPVMAVLFGFFKAYGLVAALARGIAGLAAAEYGAAGASTLLSVSFGPLMAAFAIATVAIALYQSSLEAMDKKTLEASKNLAKFHRDTQGMHGGLKREGKTEANASVKDILGLGSSKEAMQSEAEKLRTFQAEAQAKFDAIHDPSFRRSGISTKELKKNASPEEVAAAKDLDKWKAAAERFENAATILEAVGAMAAGASPMKAKVKPVREYHEIMAEAEMDTQLQSTNMLGTGGRKYVQGRLASQVKESEASLLQSRKDKMAEMARQEGDGSAEGIAKYAASDKGKKITSGMSDDPEQWKAYIELRKKLNEARKQGLDIDQQEREHALKLQEIRHQDSPEARIKAIDDELNAYTEAYKARTISEEDYNSKVRDAETHKAEQIQRQKDAQRDMNVEMAKLYGQDVKAAEIEIEKKVEAWKVAGVKAVDIEKMKGAEMRKARAEEAVKDLELEQKIADEKAGIRAKVSANKEAVLAEKLGQGEHVGGELRATRSAEAKSQVSDIAAKKARQRKILNAKLKAENDPEKIKDIKAQLADLDAAAAADTEAVTQSTESRNRADEKIEARRTGEATVGAEKVGVGRLEYKNERLKERLGQPGADTSEIGKKMIDNVAKEYALNKEILETKERMDEVDKTAEEKANLRNELQLALLKLQNDSLKAAQDITAEIEKQNALNKKSDDFTLGGTFTSYADAMAADKADSDQMEAKYHSGGKKKGLEAKLGISDSARATPTFTDAQAAKASAEDVAFPGARDGLAKTHARWDAINKAGYGVGGASRRATVVSGKAELLIKVQGQDGSVSDGGKAEIPLERAASESDQSNPLGGT